MSKLSIIIPCYNERETIRELIDQVQAVDLGPVAKEIIIVDDGSTDGTRDLLKTLPGVSLIFHEHNQGKGGAVKTGFKNATGDIVIIQDADLEYDPKDYPAVIKPILKGQTEAVLGVRVWPDSAKKTSRWHGLGNWLITLTTNLLYFNNAAEYTGCYKAFTKRLVDSVQVRSNNFAFEHELVCKILKQGNRTVDVPIRYHPRDYGEGKKINWRDGFKILGAVIWYRFTD